MNEGMLLQGSSNPVQGARESLDLPNLAQFRMIHSVVEEGLFYVPSATF